jgi:uncharacterized protein (TIGR03435 family)
MKLRFALLAASFAFAQTRKLEFEVASLKPAPPVTFTSVGISGGPKSTTPDRYTYRGARIRDLIAKAYGLMFVEEQIAGPDWLAKRWDLAATMPATTTQAEFEEMLRNLLLDRFHLKMRIESRQLPVLEMVVAKNGLKLKTAAEPSTAATPVDTNKADEDGFPLVRSGFSGVAMRSGGPRGPMSQNWVFGRQSTAQLAGFLSTVAGRRIVDKTGAEGIYDVRLQYDREVQGASAIPDRPVITLADAMEQQLGLRLIDTKAAFDVVVVESGNSTPDEN